MVGFWSSHDDSRPVGGDHQTIRLGVARNAFNTYMGGKK